MHNLGIHLYVVLRPRISLHGSEASILLTFGPVRKPMLPFVVVAISLGLDQADSEVREKPPCARIASSQANSGGAAGRP